MKLYIKEKVFSWSDTFFVKDELGNDKYTIEGEIFSWGKKLHVYDRHGAEVAFIKQELFTFLPQYTVYRGEVEAARVRKEFSFFFPRFTVDGPAWELDGSFWEHDYRIWQNGQPVASITKEWMTWGDSYELDIADSVDEILALAVVLTIDCIKEQQNNNN